MNPSEWGREIQELAAQDLDIVTIIREMSEKDEKFQSGHTNAVMALADALRLSVKQCHIISGWFEGNISDEQVRKSIPINLQ